MTRLVLAPATIYLRSSTQAKISYLFFRRLQNSSHRFCFALYIFYNYRINLPKPKFPHSQSPHTAAMSRAAATKVGPSLHIDPETASPLPAYMYVDDLRAVDEHRKKVRQAQNGVQMEIGKTLVLWMEKPAGWDTLSLMDKMKLKRGQCLHHREPNLKADMVQITSSENVGQQMFGSKKMGVPKSPSLSWPLPELFRRV